MSFQYLPPTKTRDFPPQSNQRARRRRRVGARGGVAFAYVYFMGELYWSFGISSFASIASICQGSGVPAACRVTSAAGVVLGAGVLMFAASRLLLMLVRRTASDVEANENMSTMRCTVTCADCARDSRTRVRTHARRGNRCTRKTGRTAIRYSSVLRNSERTCLRWRGVYA